MSLRFSFDPLSGKLDVGFDGTDKPVSDGAPPPTTGGLANAPPIVSKPVTQTRPKPTPQGGSVGDVTQPPKDYYLKGETIPKGIETELDTRVIDGKKRLVRVPVVPDLTPEQKTRVDEAANSEQFTYGYDPKTGEFATGMVDTPKRDPLAELNSSVENLTNTWNKVENPFDAVGAAIEISDLRTRRQEFNKGLIEAEKRGDVKMADQFRRHIIEADKKVGELTEKRLPNMTEDYFYKPFTSFFDNPLDSVNKLTTGLTYYMTDYMYGVGKEGFATIPAAAGAGSAFGPPGMAAGAALGIFTASSSYNAQEAVSEQVLSSDRRLRETYGENYSTLPWGSADKVDQERAWQAGAGIAALDIMLGWGAAKIGGKLLGKAGSKIDGEGVTVKLPKTLRKKTWDRAVGITAATLGGGVNEGMQEYVTILGGDTTKSLLDPFTNPEDQSRMTESLLVGGLMGKTTAALGATGGTAVDLGKKAFGKKQPKPVVEGVEIANDENVTGAKNIDTSGFEELVEKPAETATPTTAPSQQTVTKQDKSVAEDFEEITLSPEVIVEHERLLTSDSAYKDWFEGVREDYGEEEAARVILNERTQTAAENPRKTTDPWTDWQDHYDNRFTQFEEERDSLRDTRTPGELVERGTELGVPVAEIFTKIAGEEATVADNTPAVKSANNVIRGMVEAAEQIEFVNKFTNDPETQVKYRDAVETSKKDKTRKQKIAKVKTVAPTIPDTVLDTIKTEDLDAIVAKVPKPVQEAVSDVQTLLETPIVQEIIEPVVPVEPLAPTIEKAKEEQTKVLDESFAANPVAQAVQLEEAIKQSNEAADSLAIPSFMDRSKWVDGKPPKPSLAGAKGQSDFDTLYGNNTDTYQDTEIIRYELDQQLNPDGTTSPLGALFTELTNDLGKMLVNLTGTNIPQGVVKAINVRERDVNTGAVVSEAGAQGLFKERNDKSAGAVIVALDSLLTDGDKLSPTGRNNFMVTALHEITHFVHLNKIIPKNAINSVRRSATKIRDAISKLPGYEEIANFDPRDEKHLSEILAYGSEVYVLTSNDKAAQDFRTKYGITKDPTLRPIDAKMDFSVRNLIRQIVEAFNLVGDKINKALGRMTRDERTAEFYSKLVSGDFAAKAHVKNVEAQTKRLYSAARRNETLYSMAKVVSPQSNIPWINKVKDATATATRAVPPDVLDLNQIYSKDFNRMGAWSGTVMGLQKLLSSTTLGRLDGNYAWVQELLSAYQNVKAKLGGIWADPKENLRNMTDSKGRKTFKPLFQIMLDLRKQDISFNDKGEDGRLKYVNRDGKEAYISAEHVNQMKEISDVFTLPLFAQAEIMRNKINNMKTRPGYDSLPDPNDVKALQGWIDAKTKELKAMKVKDPTDAQYLHRIKDLARQLKELDVYVKGGKLYVPEMRSGNWAISVKNSKNEDVGLFTLRSKGKPPTQKQRRKLYDEVKAKYKNQPDLIITSPENMFELTYDKLSSQVAQSNVDFALVASLLGQRMTGLVRKKGTADEAKSFEAILKDENIAEDAMTQMQARGFSKHLLRSKHIDGASEDAEWVLDTFFSSAANAVSHAMYGDLVGITRAAYKKKAVSDTPEGRKFTRLIADLDYGLDPAADAPILRSFMYFMSLAFRPDSALLQLTPILTSVPASFASIGIQPGVIAVTMKDAFKYLGAYSAGAIKDFKNGVKTSSSFSDATMESMKPFLGEWNPGTYDYVKQHIKEDSFVLNASLPDEAQSALAKGGREIKDAPIKGRAKAIWEGTLRAGGFMMSLTERMGRTGTYLTAIKHLHNNPKAIAAALSRLNNEPLFKEYRRFNPQLDDVRAIATFMVKDAFGRTEKISRPWYTRGTAGTLLFPFQGLPGQLFETQMYQLLNLRKAGKLDFVSLAGGLLAMGSLAALGGTFAALPLISSLYVVAAELLGEKEEPGELQIRKMIVEALGEDNLRAWGVSEKKLTDYAVGGVSLGGLGIDISNRISLQMPGSRLVLDALKSYLAGNSLPADDLLGVPGSLINASSRALKQFQSGRIDELQALSAIMPAALRNAYKTGLYKDEGTVVKNTMGKPIMRSEDFDLGDVIATGLGFRTRKLKDASDRNYMDSLARQAKDSVKTNYTQRLINLGVESKINPDPVERSNARYEYNQARQELRDYIKTLSPEDRQEHFSPEDLKRMDSAVNRGIELNVNPRSETGFTDAQKRERDENLKYYD